MTDEELHELIELANFMDMPMLVDRCCAQIAIIFKSATSKEISDRNGGINLKMSREEEEQLRKEWAWIEDIDRDRYNEVKQL